MQPNLLLSPTSKQQINQNLSISSASLQQSSGLDEKSLKDIIEVLNKRIDSVKHLSEFSQTIQVPNASMSYSFY